MSQSIFSFASVFRRDRFTFLPKLVHLALPIGIQSLMMTALNLADTFMVGQLGEIQIGAIALGNQIFFLLLLFQYGVGGGAAVFSAQFWGRGDLPGVRRTLGISLVFGTIGATIFTVIAVIFPTQTLSLFSTDRTVIELGSQYLRVVAAGYIFTTFSVALTYSLRSIGNTRIPMYASAISISINIIGNYILIFGKLGFPALGVVGAGISTAIARVFEFLIILILMRRTKSPIIGRIHEYYSWTWEFVVRYTKRAAPVIANELFWSLGFTMYTVVFGRMGTSYLAAYNIADTVGRLLMVVFISTGNATAIVIGNEIGAKRTENAKEIGSTIVHTVPAFAVVVGLIGFFVIAPIVPRFFAITPEVQEIVTSFLRLYSLLMLVKTVNLHVIIGILRGGGDTQYALMIDTGPLWLIGVPLALTTGLLLGLPAHIVYLSLMCEEFVRFVFSWRRVHSGKWVHDLTGHLDPIPGMEP